MSDIKALLEARLKELTELENAGKDERDTVVLDQQSVGRLSRMDALQRQQMAAETHRRRQLERAKIGAAMQRLKDGEYGYCADCGGEIAAKRLEVDPTAHLCFDCAT